MTHLHFQERRALVCALLIAPLLSACRDSVPTRLLWLPGKRRWRSSDSTHFMSSS